MWKEDDLLDFMKHNRRFFGSDIAGINSASIEWVCKRFTCKLISIMYWYHAVQASFTDIEYEGKGDIRSIRCKNEFVLTPRQCCDIANFLAGRLGDTKTAKLSEYVSFAVWMYIEYGLSLYTDYLGIMRRMIKEDKDGTV